MAQVGCRTRMEPLNESIRKHTCITDIVVLRRSHLAKRDYMPHFDEDALDDCVRTLFAGPSTIVEHLTLADRYMQNPDVTSEKMLPKAHEFLLPLIMKYRGDLDGFVRFTTEMRDNYNRTEQVWRDIQAFYRKLNGRLVQKGRRDRIQRAVDVATRLWGPVDYHTRLKWAAEVENGWAGRRLVILEAHRSRLGTKHIPHEIQAGILDEFWETIDNEIEKGSLPKWN